MSFKRYSQCFHAHKLPNKYEYLLRSTFPVEQDQSCRQMFHKVPHLHLYLGITEHTVSITNMRFFPGLVRAKPMRLFQLLLWRTGTR